MAFTQEDLDEIKKRESERANFSKDKLLKSGLILLAVVFIVTGVLAVFTYCSSPHTPQDRWLAYFKEGRYLDCDSLVESDEDKLFPRNYLEGLNEPMYAVLYDTLRQCISDIKVHKTSKGTLELSAEFSRFSSFSTESIVDEGKYSELVKGYVDEKISEDEYKKKYTEICKDVFQRALKNPEGSYSITAEIGLSEDSKLRGTQAFISELLSQTGISNASATIRETLDFEIDKILSNYS